ncbi:MAG: hypothetical protein AB1476_03935 [Candidatus Hadarchaeota archaeon]
MAQEMKVKIKTNQQKALEKVMEYLNVARYKIKMNGNSLTATGGRDYNLGACFALSAALPLMTAMGAFLWVVSNPLAITEMGKVFSVLVIFCIVYWALFFVYWFTRKKNTVMIAVTRGNAAITFNGRKGASVSTALKEILES